MEEDTKSIEKSIEDVEDEVFSDTVLGVAFRRSDFIRIMIKSLLQMGLRESALKLEAETGLQVESNETELFLQTLLDGELSRCIEISNHLVFTDNKHQDIIKIILERKFVELLLEGNISGAITCLQFELHKIIKNSKRLTELSSLLICPNKTSLSKLLDMLDIPSSRYVLQDTIKRLISPLHFIQDYRLEKLLVQALHSQLSDNSATSTSTSTSYPSNSIHRIENINNAPRITERRHMIPGSADEPGGVPVHTYSLLYDTPPRKVDLQLPSNNSSIVLDEHEDEVWVLSFSPCGKYLASGHTENDPPQHLSWSSDSSQLLSCGSNGTTTSSNGNGIGISNPKIRRWEIQSPPPRSLQSLSYSRQEMSNGQNHHHYKDSQDSNGHHDHDNHNGSLPSTTSPVTMSTAMNPLRSTHRQEMYSFVSGGTDRRLILSDVCGNTLARLSVSSGGSGGGRIGDLAVLFPSNCNSNRRSCNSTSLSSNYSSVGGNGSGSGNGGKWVKCTTGNRNGNNNGYGSGYNNSCGNVVNGNTNGNGFHNGTMEMDGKDSDANNNDNERRRIQAVRTRDRDSRLVGYRIVFISSERSIRLVHIQKNDDYDYHNHHNIDNNNHNHNYINSNSSGSDRLEGGVGVEENHRPSLSSTLSWSSCLPLPLRFVELTSLQLDKPIVSLTLQSDYYTYNDNNSIFRFHKSEHEPLPHSSQSPLPSSSHVQSSRCVVGVVVGVLGGDFHLIDIQTNADYSNVMSLGRKICGSKQTRFRIRPSLVYNNATTSSTTTSGELLASGSEDCNDVLIWNTVDESLLMKLSGHFGMVNAVSWFTVPTTGERILASASDDHTIRLWTNNERMLKLNMKSSMKLNMKSNSSSNMEK
eukprot:gene8478-17474_t